METVPSRDPRQFLVRLWPEDLGNGEIEWRGKVQDIPTGESSYFRGWPGLVAAIQKALEPPAENEAHAPAREPGQSQAEPGTGSGE